MTLRGETFSVLGADGVIGRALCRYLANNGATVQAFGRKDETYLSRPLGHALYAIGLTADFAARPFDTVEAHISLFADLLKQASFDSMTYFSSTRLYDSSGDGHEAASLKLSPQNPRHLYDLTKAVGESLCLTSGRANVRAARLASVYGGDLTSSNFLHDLLHRARLSRTLELASHPLVARDYVHIDNVCAAIAVIATSGRQQIYNVASGRNVTNADLFGLIGRLTDCKITSTIEAHSPYETAPIIDITALERDFQLRPIALEDILPTLIG
jgi:UDP-glucose 4-epimerase